MHYLIAKGLPVTQLMQSFSIVTQILLISCLNSFPFLSGILSNVLLTSILLAATLDKGGGCRKAERRTLNTLQGGPYRVGTGFLTRSNRREPIGANTGFNFRHDLMRLPPVYSGFPSFLPTTITLVLARRPPAFFII
jgi:hypothetical protein